MSVLVRFGKTKAILRAGEWVSANRDLERRLNVETAEWMRSPGSPPIAVRDQERHVAAEMARQLDGRIMLRTPTRNRRARQVLFSLRQMEFDFSAPAGASRRRDPVASACRP